MFGTLRLLSFSDNPFSKVSANRNFSSNDPEDNLIDIKRPAVRLAPNYSKSQRRISRISQFYQESVSEIDFF